MSNSSLHLDQPAHPHETEEQRDIRLHKDIAAFSYVWIMSIVVFVARKDSKFAQFHSKQGIVLFLLTLPAALIPFFGHILIILLVAGMLYGFVTAAQGRFDDVPFAGKLSRGELTMRDITSTLLGTLHNIRVFYTKIFSHKHEEHKQASQHEPSSSGSSSTL